MASLTKRAKAAWAALLGRGGGPRATAFSGAAHNRLTQDWLLAGTRSADGELRGDLRVLKNRAREMVRNNPHARRFRRLVSRNVIGRHGICLQAKVKNSAGMPDRTSNRAIEAAWKDWCRKGNCTADGRLSFSQVQKLYVETLVTDGEALLRVLPGFPNAHGFAVQLLDTDLLDETLNRPSGDGTNEIRMGVEIDRWGRPVAYHIWDRHPNDYQTQRSRERVRIPAEQIVHDFIPERPNQTRGVTYFAPTLMRARMLDAFEEATVVAARVGASHMGFFKPNPEHTAHDPSGEADNDIPLEAEPGTFQRLPIGYDFVGWDPAHPNTAFADFDKAMLRSIAAGLDVSYNSLAADLSDVNYSSLREGKLDERDVWSGLQQWVIDGLLERLYPEWMKWALTTDALSLPARNVQRWQDHEWQPRGWDWVDPLKDIQASEVAIALGVTSRTRICAERGVDFEEVLSELAAEQALAEAFGVTLEREPTPPAARRDDDGTAADAGADWLQVIEARMSGGNGNGNGHRTTGALNGGG